MKEKRKVIDCRWFPSENDCTLVISGTEEEVLKAAADHAIRSHGEKDTRKLREGLRHLLKDAQD